MTAPATNHRRAIIFLSVTVLPGLAFLALSPSARYHESKVEAPAQAVSHVESKPDAAHPVALVEDRPAVAPAASVQAPIAKPVEPVTSDDDADEPVDDGPPLPASVADDYARQIWDRPADQEIRDDMDATAKVFGYAPGEDGRIQLMKELETIARAGRFKAVDLYTCADYRRGMTHRVDGESQGRLKNKDEIVRECTSMIQELHWVTVDHRRSTAAKEMYTELYGKDDYATGSSAILIDRINKQFRAPPDEEHRRKFVEAIKDQSRFFRVPLVKVYECMRDTDERKFRGLIVMEAAAVCARAAEMAR